MLDRALLEDLVAEARLAPSVHNVQPTRWRLEGDSLLLLQDGARRLPAADPSGHDIRLSHGAAIEGLSLALGRRGLRIVRVEAATGEPMPGLSAVARITVAPGGEAEPLAASVATRSSWRGRFLPVDAAISSLLDRLAASVADLILVTAPDAIAEIADLGDRAGFHFLCEEAHRRELLRWMRLSSTHPDYGRDGLNAEALALGRIEALGAGLVLGPLFPLLRHVGLAAPLTSERAKTVSGAVALFHRPPGEDPLEAGRAFYRAWLAMEALGLAACPISVLADWPDSNRILTERHAVPSGRRLVNVFRLGLAADPAKRRHARLPVGELIV